MSVGSAVKTVFDVCQVNRFGAGFSKFAIAMSAPEMSVPHGAGIARPSRARQVPAERRAVPAARGDLRGATGEREVRAAALDPKGLVDAPVEQDVPAGEERPCRGRIERVLVRSPWQLGVESPVGGLLDPIDAEQRTVAPGERANGGGHVLCADEPEALAVLREVAR